MSSPHVAGGVALILQARKDIGSSQMLRRLQNSADPKNWSGNPALGFLDHTHRQGAGMLDIMGVINSKTLVSPSQLSVGESDSGAKTFTINVDYEGKSNSGSLTTFRTCRRSRPAPTPNPVLLSTSRVSSAHLPA